MSEYYWQRPTAADCAGVGLKPEDFPEPHVDLWPENESAMDLFRRFATQWRAGPAGAYGLDYGVLQHELDRRSLSADEYDDLWFCIRVIEGAALGVLHRK